MKVKIGPYVNWIGPYQIAQKILFWMDRDDERIHKFGNFLAHGTTNKNIIENKDAPVTLLYRICNWIHSKKKRKISVKIDPYDTWSMDNTLAYIALPMLKQLKESSHGAALVDDEDVPQELRSTSAPPKDNDWDIDDNHFKRWNWILDEMIFAFESEIDDSWEEQFQSGNMDFIFVPVDENGNEVSRNEAKSFRMTESPNNTYKCDYDGLQQYQDRITNGFRLFGKYYQNLWD